MHWHFIRLSKREQEIAFWLAINREPVTLADLREDLVAQEANALIADTLAALETHIPIEKTETGVSLTACIHRISESHSARTTRCSPVAAATRAFESGMPIQAKRSIN